MKTLAWLALALLAACGSDTVSSAQGARLAYLGLDGAIDRALTLGLQGFNAAQSANIAPQTGNGDVSGTLTVTGQVDQGASVNKELRLKTAFVTYQDRVSGGDAGATHITYDTDAAALPALGLSLRNIPNGTFTGTLAGKVHMSGDLKGDVTLALTFTGNLQAVPGGQGVQRAPGTTHVTGTATSDYGTYTIDLTR